MNTDGKANTEEQVCPNCLVPIPESADACPLCGGEKETENILRELDDDLFWWAQDE